MALFEESKYVLDDYVATGYVANPTTHTRVSPVAIPSLRIPEATKTSIFYTKDYIGQITKAGPLSFPIAVLGRAGVNVVERSDTIDAHDAVPRTGDVAVTESRDSVVATGLVDPSAAYSNSWFNADWFSSTWFNSNWFNTAITYTGSAVFSENHDTTTTHGSVFIKGSASILENHDTTSTYGSSGNAVTGDVNVLNTTDYRQILGKVLIQGTVSLVEKHDTTSTSGSPATYKLRLSWETVGGMTNIDIYRSSDGTNYTKIASVSGGTTSYLDSIADIGKDYYYYLVGTTTINTFSTPSEVVLVDFPN